MENEIITEKKESPLKQERLDWLDKAHKYRKYGGVLSYLMKEKEGFRAFIYEELFVKKMPSADFLIKMKEKFPDLAPDEYPSYVTVNAFKKKLANMDETQENRPTALAMKDELRIMAVMNDVNFFEEEMEMYVDAKNVVQNARDFLQKAFDVSKNMAMPPDLVWTAIKNYQTALENLSLRLSKLDDLSVRFGLMPPKKMNNMLFAQQNNNNNITINNEIQEMINNLGIKPEDLRDDDKFNSKIKQVAEVILNSECPVRNEEDSMGQGFFPMGENELENKGQTS